MNFKTLRIFLLSRLPLHGEALNKQLKKQSDVIWIGQRIPIKMTLFGAPFLLLYELLCLLYHHSSKDRYRPSIIIVHFISLDALVALLFKKICCYQVLLYAIGSDVLGISNSCQYLFLKWILLKVDRVICVNHNIASYLKFLGRSDVVVLPTPFDAPNIEQFCDKEYDVITVGALIPLKEHDLLIQSCEHLPHVTAAIVGDGSLRHYLTNLANHADCKITFLGKIDHSQVWKELQKSRVYVHTSLREGIPASILEAIWCGLPVISVNSSYVKDLINLYGFNILVVERSSTSLASAIERVLREYEQFKTNALENVQLLREFTEKWENDMATVFNELLEQTNECWESSFNDLNTNSVYAHSLERIR